MSKVVITHPTLPGREVEIEEAALRHHERAGWRRRVNQFAPAPAEVDELEESEE